MEEASLSFPMGIYMMGPGKMGKCTVMEFTNLMVQRFRASGNMEILFLTLLKIDNSNIIYLFSNLNIIKKIKKIIHLRI